MRNGIFLFVLWLTVAPVYSQLNSRLTDFRWTVDSEVLLNIDGDSTYTYNTHDLFHVDKEASKNFESEFVYYPVNLADDYIDEIQQSADTSQQSDFTTENGEKQIPDSLSGKAKPKINTLWSSLHYTLGGGWVHFANCMLYALEREALDLSAPLMKRPESNWKPDPITESYKRTRKWDYYVPVNQRLAQKEYKIRKEKGQLGDIKNLPPDFVNLFLETNNREYRKMKENGQDHDLAKIDLVKIFLGANYLGDAQITYISSSVQNAVKNYTLNQIPSVLIFDEYDAAVAMRLGKQGYDIHKIAFREGASVTVEEARQRTEIIKELVAKINNYNNQAFQKRLESYYAK